MPARAGRGRCRRIRRALPTHHDRPVVVRHAIPAELSRGDHGRTAIPSRDAVVSWSVRLELGQAATEVIALGVADDVFEGVVELGHRLAHVSAASK